MQSLWMLVASLAFALMGVCIKLGGSLFSVSETVFYRSVVVLVLLEGFRRTSGRSLRTSHLRAHLLRSLVGTTGMATYFSAIAMIPLATAVTLGYTAPLFMSLILFFWYREPPPRGATLIVLTGFLGVVLLLQPSLGQDQWLGGLVGLGSGLVNALAMLNVRRLGRLGEPEWRTVYVFSAVASLIGLGWTLLGSGFHPLTGRGVWLALGMGLFGMVGQLSMTVAYKRGRALLSANLSYTTVVFASLFGGMIWQEEHPPVAWFGMGLIIAAGMVMTLMSRRPAPAVPD